MTWELKSLNQLEGAAPEGAILRHEEIAANQQALSIIERAHQQAQAIREEAREQADAELTGLRRQWQGEFWQQAQALLDDWQQAREQEQAQLTRLAGKVLHEALQQALDDVDDAHRFHALLKQLLRHHPRQQQATLWCASSQEAAISTWLASQPQFNWTVCSDNTLSPDSLRLTTAHGELLIDWPTLCQHLNPSLSDICA